MYIAICQEGTFADSTVSAVLYSTATVTVQCGKMPVHPRQRQAFGSHEPKFSEMKTNPKEKRQKEREFSASNGSARGETCICATNQPGGAGVWQRHKTRSAASHLRCGGGGGVDFSPKGFVGGSSPETALR